jgi:hypothetical protein
MNINGTSNFAQTATFKNNFIVESGKPGFGAGLTVTSQTLEVKQQASIGIHILNPQQALDVNSESIFRDTITAKNKINLTGNLLIEQTISHNWTQIGQDLSGTNTNRFGSSVAINNIGNIIAVGAPFSDINGTESGLVRIYENINTVWTQIGEDLSGINGEHFGHSLSINNIGNIIAVGAPLSNINGTESGLVRIYENTNNLWNQVGVDISGISGEQFGHSLSINSIGDKIIVGAPHNNINGQHSGVARIYKNITNSWSQMGVDVSGNDGDKFGFSVSIDGTGDIIAIGGPFHNINNINNNGIVKIFNYDDSSWQQKGNDIIGEEEDKSGYSISLSKDGSRVAIGAPFSGIILSSGVVRIYDYDSDEYSWEKLGKDILAYLPQSNSYNGWSVSLNNNGSKVIMGQPNTISGKEVGMINIYEYDGDVASDWIDLGDKIDGWVLDKLGTSDLGYSVGINGPGDKIIVGAPLYDSNNVNDVGQVNVYKIETNHHNSNIDVSGGATFSSDVNILGNLTVHGTYTNNSDKRLKENNIDITNGIELIKKLKPQIYNKRNKLELDDKIYYIKESGFIAQDIEEVEELKHLINKPKNIEKEPYTMNYIGLIAYNTAATKELDNIVEEQKMKLNSQENRIQQLENKLQSQETLINQLISRIETLENA